MIPCDTKQPPQNKYPLYIWVQLDHNVPKSEPRLAVASCHESPPIASKRLPPFVTMGQGFSVTGPPAGAAGIDVPELADLIYEKAIGSARFMKSVRARHHDGVVLVKVFIKPYTPMSLDEYRQKLICEPRPTDPLSCYLADP